MTRNGQFEAEFNNLLGEHIVMLTESVLNHGAVPDIRSYSFLAGQIHALRSVVPDLCVEANRILDGGKRGKD